MRNEFFGDINDYYKYGLLRALATGGKIKIGICWMLKKDEGKGLGGKRAYLNDPAKWRHFDPDLFDFLLRVVGKEKARDVWRMEEEIPEVIPSAVYYARPFNESGTSREKYFDEMFAQFKRVDLVFFDPDTGLAPPSAPLVRKRSSKHLYWDELSSTFDRGHSFLVIQFFPFVPREAFIAEHSRKIRERTNASEVVSFRTPNAVFFLGAQERDIAYFRSVERQVRDRWRICGQDEVPHQP